MRFRSVVAGVAWRSLHSFFRNPALIVPALLFPLFFFTAFAGGLSKISEVPGFDYPLGYTAFQFVFVLLQASAYGGVFTGFGMARDFESGFGRRMMLAAPNRKALLAGYALSALVRAGFIWVVLTGIALIAGMQVGGDAVDLVGLYSLAGIVNVAALMWSAGVALRFRSMQTGPLVQTPTFLILFTAPVYVPVDLLHGWVQAMAEINPVTPVLEAGRSLLAGQPEEVAAAIAIILAGIAVMAVWARTGLRSAERAGGN
jgi:ABC-2 type transport system permease protein